MRLHALGSETTDLGPAEVAAFLEELLDDFACCHGLPRRALIVPPDQTRRHSRSGEISVELARLLGPALAGLIPATGTHRAMGPEELGDMFPGVDRRLFRGHDHRAGTVRLGSIEAGLVESLSGGKLSFEFPASFNRDLVEGGWDLVLSVGQVVPHEVVGMANFSKNLVVGLGGAEAIDLSHWLGAVCGLETLMGRADSPVRRLLDESASRFLGKLAIVYILTVVSRRPGGGLALRGLFAGEGSGALATDSGPAAYRAAAALSASLNIDLVGEQGLGTCVVNLDPREFRSTWLGNKAVYRTRMAMADGSSLFILAPGVDRFGEDWAVDRLIRKHGYRGTAATLRAVESDPDLAANLAAAAHLVHGSSEERFRITYCTPPAMRDAIRGVGYDWLALDEALERFGIGTAGAPGDGWNGEGAGRFFYVSNPALGLWKRAAT